MGQVNWAWTGELMSAGQVYHLKNVKPWMCFADLQYLRFA